MAPTGTIWTLRRVPSAMSKAAVTLILRNGRRPCLEGWPRASWFSRRCEASSGDGALLSCTVRDGLAVARPAPVLRLLTMRVMEFVMRFDLVDLQLFIAVAETRSITAEAGRVYLALASASERIKGLELALGVAL